MNSGSYTDVDGAKNTQLAAELQRALRPHRRAVRALRGLARAVARGHGSVQVLLHASKWTTAAAPTARSPGPFRATAPRAPVAWTPRYTADAGNPRLKPTTADQLDLTYEWYFSSRGSFTAALFYKKFNDYIVKRSHDAGIHQQRRDAHGHRDAAGQCRRREGRGLRSGVPDVLRPPARAVEWLGRPGQLHVRRQQGREQLRPDHRLGRWRHQRRTR